MIRSWWFLLVVAIAAGMFLWYGRTHTPMRHMFDNMRNQEEEAVISVPSRSLASSVGDASDEANAFRHQSLVFSTRGSGYFQTGKMNDRFGDVMPPEMGGMSEDISVAQKGERVYARYCVSCHGIDGDGKGKMVKYPEFPAITAFWSEKYKNYPAGKIFRSIAEGQGNMPAFANKMTAREIWESVRWVIELQARRGNLGKEDKR